jgi:hypothetical protein
MARYAKFLIGQPDAKFNFVEFTSNAHDYQRLNYQKAKCYYRDGAWYIPEGYGLPRSESDGPQWTTPAPSPTPCAWPVCACIEEVRCASSFSTPPVEFHEVVSVAPVSGQKFDGDKDEPGLLLTGCHLAVAGVIAVLGFGFRKYKKRNGWKEVPEAKRRYKDAMHRHLQAIERGELIDPESGKPHIDHVACNAMFLSQMHHEGFGE